MSVTLALGLRAVNSGLHSLKLASVPSSSSWLSSKSPPPSALPQLPKRPPNSFLRFVEQSRAANPSLFAGGNSAGAIKKTSEQWNAMSEEERRPFEDRYKSDMQRWREETAAVEAHLKKVS